MIPAALTVQAKQVGRDTLSGRPPVELRKGIPVMPNLCSAAMAPGFTFCIIAPLVKNSLQIHRKSLLANEHCFICPSCET